MAGPSDKSTLMFAGLTGLIRVPMADVLLVMNRVDAILAFNRMLPDYLTHESPGLKALSEIHTVTRRLA